MDYPKSSFIFQIRITFITKKNLAKASDGAYALFKANNTSNT